MRTLIVSKSLRAFPHVHRFGMIARPYLSRHSLVSLFLDYPPSPRPSRPRPPDMSRLSFDRIVMQYLKSPLWDQNRWFGVWFEFFFFQTLTYDTYIPVAYRMYIRYLCRHKKNRRTKPAAYDQAAHLYSLSLSSCRPFSSGSCSALIISESQNECHFRLFFHFDDLLAHGVYHDVFARATAYYF
jgi:hypothetical protein